MMRLLLATFLVALCVNCSRVNVRYSDDEGQHSITLPFSAIEAALAYSDEGELTFDDLAGVSENINLKALARALVQEGGDVRVEMQQEGTLVKAFKQGKTFVIQTREEDEDHQMTLNLPIAMLHLIANADERSVDRTALIRTLKKQKGVLLEVKSEDENIRITIK